MVKCSNGELYPVDQQGIEAIAKLKLGQGVTVTIKRARNPGHHRKLFALLNLAYDAWEPGEKLYKGQLVAKNFEQFRSDVIILSGYYTQSVRLDGSIRTSAKSISFANMNQDEFDSLYQSVVTVVLERVLTRYTREDLDRVVEQVLGFT